jgi:PEGA domain
MKRYKFSIGAFAVAFALSTLPAAGQEKGGGGSSRPSGGSESGSAGSRSSGGGSSSGGTAVSRGGGGADSGGSTSRSSGGGMSDGSMGSSSSPSMPSSSGFGMAPMRSGDRAPQRASGSSGQSRPSGSRSNGGESSGRSAVPRGGSSSEGGSREGGSVRSGGSTSSTSSRELAGNSDRASDTGRRAVPAYSRPRDGRPTTGVAVDRGLAPVNPIVPPFNGDIYYIYRPYYYPYGFWGSAYGFGLGYLYYDPFWYGGGYGYPGYGYGGSYSTGSYNQTYRDTGNLRLKIKPREAQVYVDGYFVGVVDSFDGSFQRLSLDGGGHKVEIKADGYETLLLDVLITPGETVTYKGDMKRIQ